MFPSNNVVYRQVAGHTGEGGPGVLDKEDGLELISKCGSGTRMWTCSGFLAREILCRTLSDIWNLVKCGHFRRAGKGGAREGTAAG